MKSTTKHFPRILLLLAALGLNTGAHAAATDIANSPMASSGNTSVKPNIMFILDDSGSMNSEYLPDSVRTNDSNFCYRNSYYNGVYYNRDIVYDVPVKADGTLYPDSSFTAAKDDGFGGTATTNLSTSFSTGSSLSAQAAYYYKYTGTSPTTPVRGTCYADSKYTKVVVSATSGPGSTDERTNFANWYSYYRDRMKTMKSAAGRAFKDVTNNFRVGFSTISYTGTDSANVKFLKIADFDTTQKANWYSKLYASSGNSYTPLRAALAKAGRIYAGKLLTGTNDPMQYSCQQNFTILSTDGYWNTDTETSTYGPDKIDGSTSVGQQDGSAPRPMNDGASVTKSTSQLLEAQVRITQSTSQLQYKTVQTQQRRQQLQQGTSSTQKVTGQLYRLRSDDWGVTWLDYNDKDSCTPDTSGSQQDQCVVGQLQSRKSDDSGSTWSSWSNDGKCTIDMEGSKRTDCRLVQNWVSASSCTPVYDGSNSVDCNVGVATWANASSCTPSGSTICQTTDTGWVNVTSCTPSGPTGGLTVSCQTADTGWVGTDVCTAGSSGGGTTTCQTLTTGPTYVASCTNQTASSSNSWKNVVCTTETIAASHGVASCTPVAPDVSNSYVTTSCNTVTTGPTTIATGSSCTAEAASVANNYMTTTCTAGSGGYLNTLADVAMYYYETDLRTSALGNCTGALGVGVDVCENNVPGSGGDTRPQQHMTTFTLGLGVDGTLGYTDDYLSGTSADYESIKNGTKDWPDPISNKGAERIDDLWHAAVNGRGVYYSARDPATLVTGISSALAGVTSRSGSAAAAATSNLEPVAGDNYLFVALYRTVFWDGDLQARTIDPVTGDISTNPIWNAQPKLDLKVGASTDTRTIYTFDGGTANKLKPFLWANLTASEKGYFDTVCTGTSQLSQCAALTAAEQTAAAGENLVNYLRGQKGNEGTLYRSREHVLGDMVTSQPVYVKKPPFGYIDTNYATFRDTTQAARTPMVYVAANDGMLHAFNGDTGVEVWAYVPPALMGNLYRLADKTYSANHRYYVDGSPTVVDICPNAPASTCTAAEWKSILIGGFNAGGRGYYALDVTNPATPKGLWNFSVADDNDLGYTFGNPVVTKRKDGTWVVAVTSGYNNVLPGTGAGFLFVLNANTGQVLEKIGTGVGDTTTPSGLAKINVWINDQTDNVGERFYGGDLQGNLWRFNLDAGVPPAAPVSTAGTAVALATLGVTQPITTRPDVTLVPYNGFAYPVVMFGTGRYLGLSDLTNTDQQTVYAIKDHLSSTGLGAVRTNGSLVQQTLKNFTGTNGEALRSILPPVNPVDWSAKDGWFVDLNPANASPGERVNVDVQLQLGALTVASNVPSTNACNVGGYSFLYNFDFKSGSYLQTAILDTVGTRLTSNAMVAGMNTIRLQSGKIMTVITDTAGGITARETPTAVGSSGTASRVTWRELIQ